MKVPFYAERDANTYDDTIALVGPYYRELHEMMLRLGVESIGQSHTDSVACQALDIGSGTGSEALPLLGKIPGLRLLGLDSSEQMHIQFTNNAAKENIDPERFRLLLCDILDPKAQVEIRDELHEEFGNQRLQLIISAFTLHHFSKAEKEKVFRVVFELLEPGGVFLLGDLFNYGGESPWLTETIFNWEISWISENFRTRALAEHKNGDDAKASNLERLRKEWLHHYLEDNHLDSVSTHFDLLKNVGFTEAGNPFRYWQVGLIWARK